MNTALFALIAAIAPLDTEASFSTASILSDFKPQKIYKAADVVELARGGNYVMELIVRCPDASSGVMHFDKMTRVFLSSRSRSYNTFNSAYRSTCNAR